MSWIDDVDEVYGSGRDKDGPIVLKGKAGCGCVCLLLIFVAAVLAVAVWAVGWLFDKW